MSVGARIIELRKERNMSQGQLATALEVSRQAVSKWENGLAVPDTQKMIRLAEVLDTEVEFLATGRKGTSPSPAPTEIIKTVEVEKIIEVEKIVEVPQVVEVEKIVEVEKEIEKIVEVEKEVEKIIEVEKIVEVEKEVEKIVEVEKEVEKVVEVETVIEKPVLQKVFRIRYVRSPIEFAVAGVLGMIAGFLLGWLVM